MLHPGDLLGPYRIERELGRGGMATVYLARHERLDRPVALKILHESLRGDAELVERFLFEARAAARLSHTNIVTVHDAGQINGEDYLAMEYVEGESLAEILRRVGGALPLDFALSVIKQVAVALDYAHSRGLVHRDIKPSNILVRDNGHALLTDFGIARAAGLSIQTATGSILGTPEYMSPEQAEGRVSDGRSDVYSLGIVAFHMLTGRTPFRGESPQSILYAHVHQPLPDASALNPSLAGGLASILSIAAAKQPDQRYPTAGLFAEALASSQHPDQIASPTVRSAAPVATPAPRPQPALPPAASIGPTTPPTASRSGSGVWIYALIGFLVGLAALAIAVWYILSNQPPAILPTPTPPIVAIADTPTPPPVAGAATDTPTPSPTPTLTPSPTPTETPTPLLSPRLAYVSDRSGSPQIYTIFSDGSGDAQLTSEGRNERPFWVQDGSRILFTSDRSGSLALWAMRPDGSEQTLVAALPGAVAYSISPDEQHVAYAQQEEGDYDVHLDGALWGRLPGDQIGYQWAPNSRYIVLESASGPQVLHILAVGSTTPAALTADDYSSWNPTWSPDSRRIAFASTRDGNAGIYVVSYEGSDMRRLTPFEVWSQAPAWSPDGGLIAHVAGEADNTWSLYVVESESGNRRRLFGPIFSEATAAWAHDGSRLVFTLDDNDRELAVINRDGAAFIQLTNNDAQDWDPVWEPR